MYVDWTNERARLNRTGPVSKQKFISLKLRCARVRESFLPSIAHFVALTCKAGRNRARHARAPTKYYYGTRGTSWLGSEVQEHFFPRDLSDGDGDSRDAAADMSPLRFSFFIAVASAAAAGVLGQGGRAFS